MVGCRKQGRDVLMIAKPNRRRCWWRKGGGSETEDDCCVAPQREGIECAETQAYGEEEPLEEVGSMQVCGEREGSGGGEVCAGSVADVSETEEEGQSLGRAALGTSHAPLAGAPLVEGSEEPSRTSAEGLGMRAELNQVCVEGGKLTSLPKLAGAALTHLAKEEDTAAEKVCEAGATLVAGVGETTVEAGDTLVAGVEETAVEAGETLVSGVEETAVEAGETQVAGVEKTAVEAGETQVAGVEETAVERGFEAGATQQEGLQQTAVGRGNEAGATHLAGVEETVAGAEDTAVERACEAGAKLLQGVEETAVGMGHEAGATQLEDVEETAVGIGCEAGPTQVAGVEVTAVGRGSEAGATQLECAEETAIGRGYEAGATQLATGVGLFLKAREHVVAEATQPPRSEYEETDQLGEGAREESDFAEKQSALPKATQAAPANEMDRQDCPDDEVLAATQAHDPSPPPPHHEEPPPSPSAREREGIATHMQRSVRGGFRNRARAGTTRHIRSQSAPQTELTSDLSQPLPAASRDPNESPRASSLCSTDGLLHPTQPRPVSSAPPTEAQASSATPTQPQASSAPPSQPQASSAPPSQPQACNTTTTEGSPEANEPSTASADRFTCGDAATSRKTAQNKRKAEVKVAPPATRSRRSAVEPGYEARGEARPNASELREGKRLRTAAAREAGSGGTEAVCLTPSALPASQPVENTLNMAKSVRTPAEKKARGKGGEGCPVGSRGRHSSPGSGSGSQVGTPTDGSMRQGGGRTPRAVGKPTVILTGFEEKEKVRLSTLLINSLHAQVEERELKEMDVCGIRKVTHLVVVLPIKRTVKLCAAVSTVPHIVTEEWIKACEAAGALVAAEPYMIEGCFESNPPGAWSFNATEARRLARGGGALLGRRFLVLLQPKAQPLPADIKVILRNAGGEVVQKLHGSDDVIIVSCQEMRKAWLPHASKPGVSVISLQHLLTCVLRQNLTIEDGRLT